jgi:hypothetical protein
MSDVACTCTPDPFDEAKLAPSWCEDRDCWLCLVLTVDRGSFSSRSKARLPLCVRSISGVIMPWLTVRLCFAMKERRWRDRTRPTAMSSAEMQALGDRSASGWGRVVFRSGGL